MKAAQMAAMEHMTGDVYRVGCDIERELNEANATIRQQQLLDEENLRLNDRIKRLEAAGDEAIYPFEYAARVRIWTEAKEDKL
jgi:4'-phosphopantetheinyl transferase EntD